MNTYSLVDETSLEPDGNKQIEFSEPQEPKVTTFTINSLKSQMASLDMQIANAKAQKAALQAQIDDATSQLTLKP